MAILASLTIQNYNIGIVDTDVIQTNIRPGSIKWLGHSYKDRFFADPFLWDRDDQFYYILAEELCFFEDFGKIVLLTVDKETFSLKAKRIVIEKPFHLSWPFCVEGEDWIIPEAGRTGRCIKYRLCKETFKILEEEVLIERGLVDPVFFNHNGTDWLLASHIENPDEELFLYKKEKTGAYSLVSDKPIVQGRKYSRSAGRIFEYQGRLMRPAQDSVERYGKYTRLNTIENLSTSDYAEQIYTIFSSEDNPPYNETLHTFNYYDDIALVDGSIDVLAPRNVYYKAKRVINRRQRNL